MWTKIVIIFSAVAFVNCQLIALKGGSPCGCNAPLSINSPCACNGGLEFLAPVSAPSCGCNKEFLPAALAQLLLQNPVATKACGCQAALPNFALAEQLVAPAPLVLNAPLAMPAPCSYAPPPPCGCASSPCSCAPALSCGCAPVLPVGCTNPFLPAASPVSALAPQIVNSVLPPVCPCENKCLYLRKIPIPPPCI